MDQYGKPSRQMEGRYQVGVRLTRDEFDAVQQAARQEGTSVAEYLRRCVNGALLEAGQESVLLTDRAAPTRLRAEELRQVQTFRARCLTINQIAARMQRNRGTIWRALKKRAEG